MLAIKGRERRGKAENIQDGMRGHYRPLKHNCLPGFVPRIPESLPTPLFLLVFAIRGGELGSSIGMWALVVRGDQHPDSLKARKAP